MFTTKLRLAITAAALCGASATAEAKPRRVVVLDFDGPRSLADSGRTAVVSLLTEQYDIVTKRKWEEARTRASKGSFGPQTWSKASKLSGIDAVIEGWVQDEGRHKVLNLVVREASTGREFDTLTFKLGKSGLSGDTLGLVRSGLDDVLDYIEPGLDPSPNRLPEIDPKRLLQSKKKRAVEVEAEEEESERPSKRSKRRAEADDEDIEIEKPAADREEREEDDTEVATAPISEDRRDENDLVLLLGNKTDEWPLPKNPKHTPKPTPRFQIGAGGYIASRSLTVDSEDPQDFLGVGTKGISISALAYPFPLKKMDGALSGIGFGLNLYKAPASTVTVPLEDAIADYKIDSGGWDASVHWRQPLGSIVHIDSHVGYAQDYFNLEQDIELDVPDTNYKFFWAGANLDLSITQRATVGFGVKYLYITDNGQMSDIDWYGPGTATGFGLDGNFLIPLPARLYVRGEIEYRRISMEFDGPDIAAEGALGAADGTVNGTVHVGIQF